MSAAPLAQASTAISDDHWIHTKPAERTSWTEEGHMLFRYIGGDQSALDELVNRYRDAAFWVSRYVVNDDEVASDVVQEAFVRVLQRHERYDPVRPFKAWFLQIVRNLSIDALRRRRNQAGPDVLEGVSQEHHGFKRIERNELAERITEVLESIPEKYRELIRLRDVEGHGSDEISVMIGVDYGTTRWRIHQARKLFRQEWVARFGEDM